MAAKKRRTAIKDLRPAVAKAGRVKGGTELDQLALQRIADQTAQAEQMASNVMKSVSSTSSTIIDNLK